MIKTAAVFLAGASLAFCAAPAVAAITYTGSSNVGSSGSYSLSITTDGTIGLIGSGNITAYNIVLNDSHGSFTLTQLNSATLITGGLSATSTNLSFDFLGSGVALFQNPTTGSSQNFLCFTGSPLCSGQNVTSLVVGPVSGGVSATSMRGSAVIASVGGAVPEPATWAMMLLGFGAIGASMRVRRRQLTAA